MGSIDQRTRRHKDATKLSFDRIVDQVLPTALAEHGSLAARGVVYKQLPPLGLSVDGRTLTLAEHDGELAMSATLDHAGVVAHLPEDALSDLVQDAQSTMGLAMTSRVRLAEGNITDWIAWEPALRALLDGRKVHETGDVVLRDADGGPLDVSQSFSLDDDRDKIAHFLAEAGFLHIRDVFTESEMAAVRIDIDDWIARAEPDDGESWWAEDESGTSQAVRVLFFYDKSPALRDLVTDDRYTWLGQLSGDGHVHRQSAEGLVKPLGITKGLSDLPWHKDCGQGRHSYQCNAMTCGISVTGADRVSGALGVIPGSHRANTMATGRDRSLDLQPLMLETRTGDVTVHCSDTLHRAHPPIDQPRHVVYSGFGLPPLSGDEIQADPRYSREARAELSTVQDRITAADNPDHPQHYRAARGR